MQVIKVSAFYLSLLEVQILHLYFTGLYKMLEQYIGSKNMHGCKRIVNLES